VTTHGSAPPNFVGKNVEALRAAIQDWIYTFDSMESLDAQLDEAKVATGRLRDVTEFHESDWAKTWVITIPAPQWHFSERATSRGAMYRRWDDKTGRRRLPAVRIAAGSSTGDLRTDLRAGESSALTFQQIADYRLVADQAFVARVVEGLLLPACT
jgi:hypothetical protein